MRDIGDDIGATGPVLVFDHLETHHALEGGLGGQRRAIRHRALAQALEASTGAGGKDAGKLDEALQAGAAAIEAAL